jgi:hypothetical protein
MDAGALDLQLRAALLAEEAAGRPDPGTSRTYPTLRKGVVTAASPLAVDELPASNVTGRPLPAGGLVWLLVDAGRRLVIGTAHTDATTGTTSTGRWYRLAGGLLLCTATLAVPGSSDPFTWVYPRPFGATPDTVQATVATTAARFATISTGGTDATGAAVRVWTDGGAIDTTGRSVRLLAAGLDS